MKQEVVLQILKQKNAEMTKQFGVKSLSLFGSVAINEATATSDGVDAWLDKETLLPRQAWELKIHKTVSESV